MTIRNRIKEHRRVRAGDLIPHESDWRGHPERQREALAALYDEVGFARSLLAYEMPDGRLKLIDGHLRRDLEPDMLVDVEILDVDDEEARKLLLSMDSLAAEAETKTAEYESLLAQCKTDSPVLKALWRSIKSGRAAKKELDEMTAPADQFLILVECGDEAEQVRLLQRFYAEGISCRALVS